MGNMFTFATDMETREKKIYKVTLVGSVVNVLLLIFKFIAGALGHSSAMIADAFHSLSDFISDIVVVVFVKLSGKPEDSDHAYGHGKYETLASVIVGLMLTGVGLALAYDGIVKIVDYVRGVPLEMPNWWALSAAIISILLKEGLYHYTARAGKDIDSSALIANAWHHRSDSLTSIAALLGIGGAMILGEKWVVLDPLASVVVSLFIVVASFSLMRPGLNELLEKSLPEKEIAAIGEIVENYPGVKAFHHLRTRRVGHGRAIEIHVKMSHDISLRDAHDIASGIERKIKERFGSDTHVGIHMEPFYNEKKILKK